MADLTIKKLNVTKLLQGRLREIGKGNVTLVEVPAENHLEANVETLRILMNELQFQCVYITFGKPCKDIEGLLKAEGVNTNRIYYIDMISRMFGMKSENTKRSYFTGGPLEIGSIFSQLSKILKDMRGDKQVVFLDSVTTALLYNSLPRTKDFLQLLARTLKKRKVVGILISSAKGGVTTDRLVSELAKQCGEIITIA